jgi:hypothetical protein
MTVKNMQKSKTLQGDSPKIKALPLPFIALLGVIASPRQEAKPGRLSNIYTRCNELPLSLFIDITVYKDLSLLYKDGKGEVTPELEAIWSEIYSEYAAIVGGADYLRIVNLNLEAMRLRIEIQSIEVAIHQAKIYNSEVCIDALGEMGYPIDRANLTQSLTAVRSRAKGLIVKLRTIEAELLEIKAKSSKVEPTRQYFEELIDSYEKYKGFTMPENITTYRFAIGILMMQNHYKRRSNNG